MPPPARFIRRRVVKQVVSTPPPPPPAITEGPEDFAPAYDPLAVSLYHAMGNSYGNEEDDNELPVTQDGSPKSAKEEEEEDDEPVSVGFKRSYSAVDTEDDDENAAVLEEGGESSSLQFLFSDPPLC